VTPRHSYLSHARFEGATACSCWLVVDCSVRLRYARQVRVPQVRARQVRARQVRARQVRALQARARQVRVPQVRARQVRARQVRARQVRARQVRARQVRAVQARARQVRARQVCAREVRAVQVRARLNLVAVHLHTLTITPQALAVQILLDYPARRPRHPCNSVSPVFSRADLYTPTQSP